MDFGPAASADEDAVAIRGRQLHGDRVILPPTQASDLSDLMALWNDGRVMTWVGFPAGLGYDHRKMADWLKGIDAGSRRHHFVVHADPLGFCGEVYCEVDTSHRRAGLDLKFRPAAQGQGLATEALLILIDWVFETFEAVDAVWTEPSVENLAAMKLYARCRFAPCQRPPDLEQGLSYWALTRKEWQNHGSMRHGPGIV